MPKFHEAEGNSEKRKRMGWFLEKGAGICSLRLYKNGTPRKKQGVPFYSLLFYLLYGI